MNVLLVTPSPRIAQQVTAALGPDTGAAITQVAAPQRALALLDEGQRFDVVVADNDTAPAGGFHLSREIKARAQMGNDMPPIVLLIARPQDRFLSKWSQADANVLKPADPFDLAEVIDAVVRGAPVPALPGVGSQPTATLADVPGPDYEQAGVEQSGGVTGGGP